MTTKSRFERALLMIGLIVCGEAVFALPFHVARFFRATLLDVLDLTNTELGAAQAAYGVAAMLAYFPGGPLADRFSARKLLALALGATAAGGLFLSTFPHYYGALAVWAFWGVTTILLFWAALIRATREWGGSDEQGRAYGFLDGGRGVLAAGMASMGAFFLGWLLPADVASASMEQKELALRTVIYAYTAVTGGAAVLVWFVVPDTETVHNESLLHHVGRVVKIPAVWLQALIIICAYVGYKGFDNYSLFAVECYGLDVVEAAHVVAIGAWVRPFAAVGAGLLGDRFRSSRVIVIAFAMMLLSDLYFALATPVPGTTWILMANIIFASTAVFGLRGLYFAVFEEAKVPVVVTGTAVGLVSVIGYTPDIFVTLVQGKLLDNAPGLLGHQHFFMFLAVFGAIGLIVSLIFTRLVAQAARTREQAE
jgi:nitrate/nitrite transporter NarK